MQKGFVTVGHHPFLILVQPPIEKPRETNVVLLMVLVLAGSYLTL